MYSLNHYGYYSTIYKSLEIARKDMRDNVNESFAYAKRKFKNEVVIKEKVSEDSYRIWVGCKGGLLFDAYSISS